MSIKKILTYSFLILVIILSILLSMLNISDDQERQIAVWASAGILSIVFASVALLASGYTRPISILVLQAIFLPLLGIVITSIGFTLLGLDQLFQVLFFSIPAITAGMLLCTSIVTHLAIILFRKNPSNDSPNPT